jgi:hypothetical protein
MVQAEKIQQTINKVSAAPEEAKRALTKDELAQMQDYASIENLEMYNGTFATELDNDSKSFSRKEGYQTFKEMALMSFIYKALEIIADDSTQKNQEGNVLNIYSNDERIKARLEDLFFDRLNINNTLWSIVLETAQMGDSFHEIMVDSLEKPKKVMSLKHLEPPKVDRVEIDGRLAFFCFKKEIKNNFLTKNTQQNIKEIIYKLQPWQVAHFLIDDKDTEPYGRSLLKSGVRIWDRLLKVEDASLIYRLSRAPERRVFYVDVGSLNNIEASKFLRKFRDNYRTQSVIDEDGKINKRASVFSLTSDIFIPVRGGEGGNSGTKIDTLQGGTALGGQDDLLKYFKDSIIRMLNIPPAYLGDEIQGTRGSLSSLDIKFSKFIERIQNRIITGLNKIAAIDLFFGGFKTEEIGEFKIELTPPSNIREITELEFINQKIMLIQSMIGLNIFPTNYILKKVLNMSDKEIANLQFYKKLETEQANAATAGGSGVPIGAEGGTLPPGGEIPPGTEIPPGGEIPPGAEFPPGSEIPPGAAPAPAPAPVAGNIPQESFINILGKDFLLENKGDFFKIMKYIDLNEKIANDKEALSPLFESIASYVQRKKLSGFKTKEIENYKINNEFGGLSFNNNNITYFEDKFEDIKDLLNESIQPKTSKIDLQES